MQLTMMISLALALAALVGCGGVGSSPEHMTSANSSAQVQPAVSEAQGGSSRQAAMQNVSLQQAGDSQSAPAVAVERKVIRNATLALEVEEPSKVMQRIASVAETRGGFVVNTESRQQSGSSKDRSYEIITLEMRIPAAQFDAALGDIRASGRVTSEKLSGKDVTEEYIDLEARLRTQKALESQLLEIMKGAHNVADAISVERELTNVRTEIERVEGRRRFLDNQSSLSTFSVTLQPPAPLVSTTGFFHSIAAAFGQGLDIAAAVTLFLIRAVLALLPVAIFLGLPAYFLLRFLVRRLRRRGPAPPPPTPMYEAPPTHTTNT
jgi:hypothetical protein